MQVLFGEKSFQTAETARVKALRGTNSESMFKDHEGGHCVYQAK